MPSKYDPSMSSRDYLELARRLPGRNIPDLDLSRDDFFDRPVHDRYVGYLLDTKNWTDVERPPRVFIDVYMNQSRNLEVRWGSGPMGIWFPEDFEPGMAVNATGMARGSTRPIGELMWVSGFGFLAANTRGPFTDGAVEQMLLFGYRARLDELVRDIGKAVDVVGGMTFDFQYEGDVVTDVFFRPTIPEDRLKALWRAAHYPD